MPWRCTSLPAAWRCRRPPPQISPRRAGPGGGAWRWHLEHFLARYPQDIRATRTSQSKPLRGSSWIAGAGRCILSPDRAGKTSCAARPYRRSRASCRLPRRGPGVPHGPLRAQVPQSPVFVRRPGRAGGRADQRLETRGVETHVDAFGQFAAANREPGVLANLTGLGDQDFEGHTEAEETLQSAESDGSSFSAAQSRDSSRRLDRAAMTPASQGDQCARRRLKHLEQPELHPRGGLRAHDPHYGKGLHEGHGRTDHIDRFGGDARNAVCVGHAQPHNMSSVGEERGGEHRSSTLERAVAREGPRDPADRTADIGGGRYKRDGFACLWNGWEPPERRRRSGGGNLPGRRDRRGRRGGNGERNRFTPTGRVRGG